MSLSDCQRRLAECQRRLAECLASRRSHTAPANPHAQSSLDYYHRNASRINAQRRQIMRLGRQALDHIQPPISQDEANVKVMARRRGRIPRPKFAPQSKAKIPMELVEPLNVERLSRNRVHLKKPQRKAKVPHELFEERGVPVSSVSSYYPQTRAFVPTIQRAYPGIGQRFYVG